ASGDCMPILIRLILFIVALGSFAVPPAQAQIFDPNYPVCIHIYGELLGERMDCIFKSLEQCAMTASGLPAICLVNPTYKANHADGSTSGPRRSGPGRKATATHRLARRDHRSHPE